MESATVGRPYARSGLRTGWTPINVVLMIIGFAFFWPLGLAMLAWIVWGNELKRLGSDLGGNFRALAGSSGAVSPFRAASLSTGFGGTGNLAFDEYRARELERLEAERRKVESMRAEFETFVTEMRKAKDKEEFDRFLAEYNRRKDIEGGSAA